MPQNALPKTTSSPLVDQFGRRFSYLRLAINERCNLRCVYCMPEDKVFRSRAKLLQTSEIKRLVNISSHLGVRKIRFTGGEPLLHPQLPQFIEHAANTPNIQSVHLTTNGVLLAKKIDTLVAAGLTGINISIDSLDAKTFHAITRRNQLERVLTGIKAAVESPIQSVKLNVVAMRKYNEDSLQAFAEWTRQYPITVRFIELMPFDDQQIWKTGKFYGAERLAENLKKLSPQLKQVSGSATEYQVFQLPQAPGKLAIIPAYSRQICSLCNRFRITADGRMRNCLYAKNELNLLAMLRGSASDEDIGLAIRSSIHHKAIDGWSAQKAEGTQANGRTSMSQIGG